MPAADDSNVHRLIDLATAEYAREREGRMTWHPSTDELIAFQEARLGPSQTEKVRAHLVDCRWCAEEIALLDSYDEEVGPQDQAEGASAPSGWRRFLARVRAATEVPIDEAPGATGAPPSVPMRSWTPWILAASVLIAAAGIVALALAFGRFAGSGGAGRNAYVLDLVPEGAQVLRSAEGGEVESAAIPSTVDTIVLRLHLGDLTEQSGYFATITTTAGETVWRQTSLHRQPTGGFALVIPREALPNGDYELHLRGEADRLIAVYHFRLHELR